ncbi:hypothetical protein SAMN04487820_11268 [Actinopolyspora mzabensis]|uniref:Uncharacterized protein n=1 Tax=Actinopolyspora mzabensis TaxID=995066 RepID=A0A1G9EI19_ACTMZ|nr:DUF2267 domain-containing protein [Actinopolyspora mzabensis]SDK75790.1 hypothetical protein SAMN04487820_11268 [Actinopolyspora mzabensis]
MPTTNTTILDHAVQMATKRVQDVCREFDTDRRHFAYRVLRAWMHTP